GNVYLTSTQATMRPKIALTSAAINEAPKLRRSEAITRGAVTTCQKWPQPDPKLRMKTAHRGISTSNDRYTMVYPSVSPKPGTTRCGGRRVADLSSSTAATGAAMEVLRRDWAPSPDIGLEAAFRTIGD